MFLAHPHIWISARKQPTSRGHLLGFSWAVTTANGSSPSRARPTAGGSSFFQESAGMRSKRNPMHLSSLVSSNSTNSSTCTWPCYCFVHRVVALRSVLLQDLRGGNNGKGLGGLSASQARSSWLEAAGSLGSSWKTKSSTLVPPNTEWKRAMSSFSPRRSQRHWRPTPGSPMLVARPEPQSKGPLRKQNGNLPTHQRSQRGHLHGCLIRLAASCYIRLYHAGMVGML